MKLKLIVQIPAYNEEQSIAEVIKSIPRSYPGIETVEVLVWSDGSTDATVEEAKKAGADHVFASKKNLGLAKTFSLALAKCVELGADIIVNTDADNQYDQKEIALLIAPIVNGKADMVNGDRQVDSLSWMVPGKKYGNRLGSAMLRSVAGTTVNDASSGFRAFSKECARKFTLFSQHTYTHETLIQAAQKDLVVAEVPITFIRREHGESRLIGSIGGHIKKSLATIFRSILMYRAFKVLSTIGLFLIALGVLVGLRFLYFFLLGRGEGHIQSLIFSAMVIITGVNTVFLGFLADLISQNRKILEHIYEKI